MPTVQHRRKSGLFVPAELADGEIGVNRAAGRLEFSSNGAIQPVVSVPTGGTTGQVLTKTSASDYATSWQTPSASGGSFSGDPALIPYAAAIPKAPRAGTYYDQATNTDTSGTSSVVAGSVRGGLVVSPVDFRISGIKLAVSTGANSGTDEAYLSIYTADSGGFWPGSRVYQSGAITGWTTGAVGRGPDLDFTLVAFTAYWFVMHFGSNPTVRTLNNSGSPSYGLTSLTNSTYDKSLSFSRAITNPMPTTFDIPLATALSATSPPASFRMTAF